MKTLIRFAFAAILAASAYSYSIGSENAVKMMDPDPDATYKITDTSNPHYDPNGSNEFRFSEAEDICPESGVPCAELQNGDPEENPAVLEWEGSTTKF